ncbi:MAG TPA: DUF6036 family nucleotidyltransferase [Terracidiphilus sp.]|jgi:hypothetical protein|nr:DUF6036 family nucleotidyltransferase [Terracidiphilus sp.]
MISKDFQDILRAFNAHKVKYLVVGGFAFGVHLEPRSTKDIDLWIRNDPENAKAVFQALAEFGAPIAGMTPNDLTDGTIFQMGQPPERIDILQQVSGLDFDNAWAHRLEGFIDENTPALVISRDDLIQNKLASGREQDLLDVKKLRAVEQRAKLPRR